MSHTSQKRTLTSVSSSKNGYRANQASSTSLPPLPPQRPPTAASSRPRTAQDVRAASTYGGTTRPSTRASMRPEDAAQYVVAVLQGKGDAADVGIAAIDLGSNKVCSTADKRVEFFADVHGEGRRHPKLAHITNRLDAVQELYTDDKKLADIRDGLKEFQKLDLEKLVARISQNNAHTEKTELMESRIDLLMQLRHAVAAIPKLQTALATCDSALLAGILTKITHESLAAIEETIKTRLSDDAHSKSVSKNQMSRYKKAYAVQANCSNLLDIARFTYKENVGDIHESSSGLTIAVQYFPEGFSLKADREGFMENKLAREAQNVISKKDQCVTTDPPEDGLTQSFGSRVQFSTAELKRRNARMNEALEEIFRLSNDVVLQLTRDVIEHIRGLYDCAEGLGRGTAPLEGVGIAHAIAEALIKTRVGVFTPGIRILITSQAFVFFATHFGDLSTTLSCHPGVQKFGLDLHFPAHTLIVEQDARRSEDPNEFGTKFNYRVVEGECNLNHYGIELAKLAVLPSSVMETAMKVSNRLQELEQEGRTTSSAVIIAARRRAIIEVCSWIECQIDLLSGAQLPRKLRQMAETSRLQDAEMVHELRKIKTDLVITLSKARDAEDAARIKNEEGR
ncbi:hypothetical protein P7C73_g80, partial [Tremellales sp. Uapishka_1]